MAFDNRYTDVEGTPKDMILGTGELALPLSQIKKGMDGMNPIQKFEVAKGTATSILLDSAVFVDKVTTTFIATGNTTGSQVTSVNGRILFKQGSNNYPKLTSGRAYTIWWDATYNNGAGCFFLKASATGTATPDKVLAGETFSNDTETDLVGTMVKGAYIKSWQWGQFTLATNDLFRDASINTVNVNKAIIRLSFYTSEGITRSAFVVGSFINNNTIRFTRNDKGYESDSFVNVIWEVYEFDDSIKLQFGGTAILNSNSVVITLSPTPDLSKCLLFYDFNDNSNEGGSRSMIATYRNGNQLTFVRGRVANFQSSTVFWFLVEFP